MPRRSELGYPDATGTMPQEYNICDYNMHVSGMWLSNKKKQTIDTRDILDGY